MDKLKHKRNRSIEDRFKSKYEINESGCWLWTDCLNQHGYGIIRVDKRNKIASRLSYELIHGPIQSNMLVCHKCDNPACVNPDHLFIGTHKDNTTDMVIKGRVHLGERNHRSKLTNKDVLYIRSASSKGETTVTLGKQFNVTRHLIGDIVRRKIWRHL